MRRKVVCIFGEWGENTDFVLEPVCSLDCKCEECVDAFWIEDIKEKEK